MVQVSTGLTPKTIANEIRAANLSRELSEYLLSRSTLESLSEILRGCELANIYENARGEAVIAFRDRGINRFAILSPGRERFIQDVENSAVLRSDEKRYLIGVARSPVFGIFSRDSSAEFEFSVTRTDRKTQILASIPHSKRIQHESFILNESLRDRLDYGEALRRAVPSESGLRAPDGPLLSREEMRRRLAAGGSKESADRLVLLTDPDTMVSDYARLLQKELCKDGEQRCSADELKELRSVASSSIRRATIMTDYLAKPGIFVVIMPGFENFYGAGKSLREVQSDTDFGDQELDGRSRDRAVFKVLVDFSLYHEGDHTLHYADPSKEWKDVARSEALADGKAAFLLLRDAYRDGSPGQISLVRDVLERIERSRYSPATSSDYRLAGSMLRRMLDEPAATFLDPSKDIDAFTLEILRELTSKRDGGSMHRPLKVIR